MGNNKFFKTGQQAAPGTGLSIVQTNTQSGVGGTLTHNLTGVPAGALIVITTGSNQAQTNATVGSTPALTFTKQVDASTPLSPGAEIWTAVYTAGGSLSVTVSWGAAYQSSVAYVVTGQEIALGGSFATGLAQGTSNVNITTSKTNSLVFAVASNWNAPTLPLTYRGSAIQSFATRDAANGTFAHYYYPFAVVSTYITGYSDPNDVDNGTSSAVLEIRSSAGSSGGNTPPSAPILVATNSGNSFVDLSWTAATDNVAVTGYEIYKDGVLQTTVTGLTNTQSGLNSNTTYSFKVRAIDGAGLGTDSNTISVTTSPVATTTTTTTTSVGPTTTTTTTTTIPQNPFTFIALSGDYSRYWGGSEVWNENSGSQIASGVPTPRHYYRRFSWIDIEPSTQGGYSWAKFDSKVQTAVNNKQLFSFGIMTIFPEIAQAGGFNSFQSGVTGIDQKTGNNKTATLTYPIYLHNLMQGESTKDWVNSSNDWIPNFNSLNYINRLGALYAAIVSHLASTTYSGILGSNVIGYVDLRGMGAYGEWHSNGIITGDVNQYPGFVNPTANGSNAGTFPSQARLIQIVDAHRNNITSWPLCTILNSLDGNFPNGGNYNGTGFDNTTIPAAVGQYIINNGNAWGDIGWRRDQWGDINDYYRKVPQQTNAITDIPTRWMTAPVLGEPPGYNNSGTQINGVHMRALNVAYTQTDDGGDNGRQVALEHPTFIGNGNYGGNIDQGSPAAEMRTAFTNTGCVLRLVTGGGITLTATQMQITLLWRNFGVAPQYKKNWQVTFELRTTGGSLVWSDVSSLNLFSNSGLKNNTGSNTQIVDTFTKPALAAATYQLSVIIKDPNGYCEPLQLGIQGRQTNGSYILSNVTF